MLSIKGAISVCREMVCQGRVPKRSEVKPQSIRVGRRAWNRISGKRFHNHGAHALRLANMGEISQAQLVQKGNAGWLKERRQVVEEKLKLEHYLGPMKDDSSGSHKGVENVDFRVVQRPTEIGRLMEAFEKEFWADAYWETGPNSLRNYNYNSFLRDYFQALRAEVWPIRRLAEWQAFVTFSIMHHNLEHSESFRRSAKRHGVDDPELIEKWEWLRKVAARTGRKEPLKTSVQDLMQAYRQRMEEYRKSEYRRNEVEKEENERLKVKTEQPYVKVIESYDDEARVERIFSTILPRVLKTHPTTGNLTLEPRKTNPKRRPQATFFVQFNVESPE